MTETNIDVSIDNDPTGALDPATLVCGHEDPAAFRELLTKVGDKWSILILLGLSMLPNARARFSGLNRLLPPISERMLALTLRSLERDGLVKREVFAEVPPRVEYELTGMGRSLLPALQGLVDWVADNADQVKGARIAFEAR